MNDTEKEFEETKQEKLIRHIRTTYKARYSANRRLINIDKIQKITSIVISISIVATSTVLLADILEPNEKLKIFNALLVVLSIISLVLSVLIGGNENKIKANEYHACASEIQKLFDTILATKNEPEFNFEEKINEYHIILDKYRMNHDMLDWEYVLFEKYKENKKGIFALIFFRIKYFIFTYLLYLTLMITPIILIFLFIKRYF